jgi:hypothetical protein
MPQFIVIKHLTIAREILKEKNFGSEGRPGSSKYLSTF